MADGATTVALARAVLAHMEEMEKEVEKKEDGEEEEEEEGEEEEKKEKPQKKKKKTKHLVAAATEKLETFGVEAAGGEDLVPSRTKAKKKEHARGVAVLGGLGELGFGCGGEAVGGGEEMEEGDEEEDEEL